MIAILCSKNNYIVIFLFKGILDIDVRDPKIVYLKNALLIEEEMLPLMDIKVGILGQNRSEYDIMLMPYEEKEPKIEPIEIDALDKKILEMRKSVPMAKLAVSLIILMYTEI